MLPRPAPRPAVEAEPYAPGRLLRLAACCPRCGSRPALRVEQGAVEALGGRAPKERIGTYQCHRRGCGAIYDLTAAAYQRAE